MKIRLVIIILVCFSGLGFAQNFNDALRLSLPGNSSDAKSVALGNSTMAVGGGLGSYYFNPAGIALIKKSKLSLGMDIGATKNTSSFLNNKDTGQKNFSNFNNAAYAYKLPTTRGSLVLVFSYNRDKDYNRNINYNGFNYSNQSIISDLTNNNDDLTYELGLSYPIFDTDENYLYDSTIIGGNLDQSAVIQQEGVNDIWSFGGSVEFSKNIFFGVNFGYVSGRYKSNRQLFEIDTKDIYPVTRRTDPGDQYTAGFESFLYNDIVDWNYSGWDIQFGLLARFNNLLNLGASVKLPKTFRIEERFSVNGESDFSTGTGYSAYPIYEDFIKYKVKTPLEFNMGAMLNLFVAKISGSVKLIDYSEMEFRSGLPGKVMNDNNAEIRELFKNSYEFNFGSETKIPFYNIRARVGFIYKSSPFKEDKSNFDKKFITVGLGLLDNTSHSLDLAFVHGWWDGVSSHWIGAANNVHHSISYNKFYITYTTSLR